MTDERQGVRRTPSGRWSIPCENCGKRHIQPYSDDFVWCRECQKACGERDGHHPDDDNPALCFRCGATLPPPQVTKLEQAVGRVARMFRNDRKDDQYAIYGTRSFAHSTLLYHEDLELIAREYIELTTEADSVASS
jgi:hypothetical protein